MKLAFRRLKVRTKAEEQAVVPWVCRTFSEAWCCTASSPTMNLALGRVAGPDAGTEIPLLRRHSKRKEQSV